MLQKISQTLLLEIWIVTQFFVILDKFLSFYPANNPENQNLKKWQKKTLNDYHMMYGPWDMEHNRCNFLSFWPLPLSSHPENQNSEKMKKTTSEDIIILPICTIDGNHMMYGSWYMELWSMTDKFFVILGHFLPFYST